MSSHPRLRASMLLSLPGALPRPDDYASPGGGVRARHGPSGGERQMPGVRTPLPERAGRADAAAPTVAGRFIGRPGARGAPAGFAPPDAIDVRDVRAGISTSRAEFDERHIWHLPTRATARMPSPGRRLDRRDPCALGSRPRRGAL